MNRTQLFFLAIVPSDLNECSNFSLSDAREHIQEQKSKLQVLHTTIAFQEQNLKDFEDR